MLTERKILGQIEVQPNGVIFIKEYNQVLRDGVVINSIPHRSSVCPLDDVSNHKYALVRDTVSVIWTPELKAKYAAEQTAASQNRLNGVG